MKLKKNWLTACVNASILVSRILQGPKTALDKTEMKNKHDSTGVRNSADPSKPRDV